MHRIWFQFVGCLTAHAYVQLFLIKFLCTICCLGHCDLNTCFPSSPMPGEHAGGGHYLLFTIIM